MIMSRAATLKDHPRSRGVYRKGSFSIWKRGGSSPLARGLLGRRRRPRNAGGIIPARAGFTEHPIYCRVDAQDHPRSRGVYGLRQVLGDGPGGSSPLARGLLRPSSAHGERMRIIPARAGFTYGRITDITPFTDHPRSRGVYPHPRRTRCVCAGSSPLARGLRPGPIRTQATPGIIPARAGFTISSRRPPLTQRDHPRSRGVYRYLLSILPWPAGSSPLARGLRPPLTRSAMPRRIIPARAGFTSFMNGDVVMCRDHPRSRGVYQRRPFHR